MFTSVFVSLALAASALAGPYFTAPTAGVTYTAGTPGTMTWIDGNWGVSLSDFGAAKCSIAVGNAIAQTELQQIASSLDMSAPSSYTFTPDASTGPNSCEYFIRCTSVSGVDSKTGYHYQTFSAKFCLAGMSGQFTQTAQDQINGQTTAPLGPTSTSAASNSTSTMTTGTATTTGKATTTGMTTSVSKATTTATGTTAAAASTATTASTNGAGKPVITTGFVALVATLIGASFL